MLKRLAVLPLVALAAAAIAANPQSGAAASTATVKLGDDYFSPKTKSVERGTKVRFRWTGRAPHNVTVSKGPVTFHSKTITRGSYTKTFTRKGTYRLVCTIHPGMEMTLKVK